MSGLTPAYLAVDINLVDDSSRRIVRSAVDRTCVIPLTHNIFDDKLLPATVYLLTTPHQQQTVQTATEKNLFGVN